jgi:peptidoglycan/LPS O-acetylase OafA/YrhL
LNLSIGKTGGQILLAVIAFGLVCYIIWRFIQAFADTQDKGKEAKGLAVRARYLLSGIVYGALAFHVVKKLVTHASGSGDSKQDMARELLSQPMGQWLLGLTAVIIAGVGIYQIYYGMSEKYKNHIDRAISDSRKRKIVLGSGKVGYVARGVVWLLIAWLFIKAAIDANAKEAGDTSKVFSFLSKASYGTYLLGAIAFGLLCYGIFSFVRVVYEDLGT